LLDLSEHPDAQFLKARFNAARWGRGESKALFGVYLFAQETETRVAAKSA
jgi:hypothetical protein